MRKTNIDTEDTENDINHRKLERLEIQSVICNSVVQQEKQAIWIISPESKQTDSIFSFIMQTNLTTYLGFCNGKKGLS